MPAKVHILIRCFVLCACWLFGAACTSVSAPAAVPSLTPQTVTAAPVATLTVSPSPAVTPITPTAAAAPHVEVSLSSATLKVGDEVTITGRSVGIGMAAYVISFSSGGLINTTFENHTSIGKTDSLFDIVSVKGMNTGVELVLRARQPGTTTIHITASGEVVEYSGGTPAFVWGGGEAPPIEITITG